MTNSIENLQRDIAVAAQAMRRAGRVDLAARLRHSEANLLHAEAEINSLLRGWQNSPNRTSPNQDGTSQ